MMAEEQPLDLRVKVGGRIARVDLSNPIHLAVPLDFTGPQPSFFGAAPASARPYAAGSFVGAVSQGGSCNCSTYTLTPHCNGTHTESVGHILRETVSIHDVASVCLLPARVVTVTPRRVADTTATSRATPADLVITPELLDAASIDSEARHDRGNALVIRTLPNTAAKKYQSYADIIAPYLTQDAASWIVERGIEHLLVDLPSIDRANDDGRLAAHRIFWGLPVGSTTLAEARRPGATLTELIYVPPDVQDGWYVLNLQLPAFVTDAAPSRPVLFPLQNG